MKEASQICQGEFYSYADIKDLANMCESSKKDVRRCRAIGILHSEHGRFYLGELDFKCRKNTPEIQLSMAYLKKPIPSVLRPYPVQIFGVLQWKNRPVIFVTLLQVLSVPMALRLRDTMSNLVRTHLAQTEIIENTYPEEMDDVT